jgi:hypothetical protein
VNDLKIDITKLEKVNPDLVNSQDIFMGFSPKVIEEAKAFQIYDDRLTLKEEEDQTD